MAKATNTPIVPFAIKGGFESWGQTRKLPKLFNTIIIQFGQPVTDFERDEKEIAHELQTRVNFMKKSLERRAFYKIDHRLHSNFLDLMQEKSEAQPVISLEEILEKEKAKYDSIILEGEYTIYDIRLEYIAQPVASEENAFNLIPVWRFSVEHRYEQAAKTEDGESFEVVQNTYDLYDALTGEEIPYNAGSI